MREPDTTRPGFDRKMTREEISRLPIRRYEGPVHVVRRPEDVDEAVERIGTPRVVGFDVETKPVFVKGKSHPPALIQLATAAEVHVFQLRYLGLPEPLCRFLSDPRVIKAGVALDRDVADLKELSPFEAAGFVDLGDVARQADLQNHGLRGLAAVMLGFRISKGAQRSNWGRRRLSRSQIAYAATDAWVGRELYLRMKEEGLIED